MTLLDSKKTLYKILIKIRKSNLILKKNLFFWKGTTPQIIYQCLINLVATVYLFYFISHFFIFLNNNNGDLLLERITAVQMFTVIPLTGFELTSPGTKLRKHLPPNQLVRTSFVRAHMLTNTCLALSLSQISPYIL